MKIVLVYMSPNTTTRMISRELSARFQADGHEVAELDLGKGRNRDFESVDLSIFRGADIVGIGSPVYHMKALAPLTRFLERALPEIKSRNNGLKAFIYLTYGGITSGKAFLNTANLLRQHDIGIAGGLKVRAPHFWHLDGYPDTHASKTVEAFCKAMAESDFRAIGWDRLSKRFSNQKPVVRLLYPFTGLIANVRKMPVEFDPGKCIKCKKCANECPVGAIGLDGSPFRNMEKCICCYHCTVVCPKDAVIFDADRIKKMLALNKKIVGMEQPESEVIV